MTKRLTPWFSVKVKPVRVGVYNASIFMDATVFRKWDGTAWSIGYPTAKRAAKSTERTGFPDKIMWRGLAEKP